MCPSSRAIQGEGLSFIEGGNGREMGIILFRLSTYVRVGKRKRRYTIWDTRGKAGQAGARQPIGAGLSDCFYLAAGGLLISPFPRMSPSRG